MKMSTLAKKGEAHRLLGNFHNLPFEHELAQVATAVFTIIHDIVEHERRGTPREGKQEHWSCMYSAWEFRSSACRVPAFQFAMDGDTIDLLDPK